MQNQFEIRKGIPLPPKSSLKGRKFQQWPFKTMEVGDSVIIPRTIAPLARIVSAYQGVERRAKTEISFAFRELEEGIGVWRIK